MVQIMMFTLHKSAAFSLIELLVSIVIIMLLVGGALVGYTSYTEKQRLVAAADSVQSGIREAQNMAKIGHLGDCAELDHIRFYTLFWSGKLYHRIETHCADATNHIIVTKAVDSDLAICTDAADTTCTQTIDLEFEPYGHTSSLTRTLKSTRSSNYATFAIDQGGSIKVTYY